MKQQLKQRILTEEIAYDFFFIHDSIIYGALKKCQIPYSHENYEDYVQIGRMKLVEVYETFPNDLHEEEYFYQFTGYAFQKVKWGILDEVRKSIRKSKHERQLPEEWEPLIIDEKNSTESDIILWDLFRSMLDCLTDPEQSYLTDAVIHQLSVSDIAKKHGVSRKTVYAWRKRVAIKLAHYKSVLER